MELSSLLYYSGFFEGVKSIATMCVIMQGGLLGSL